MNAIRNFVQLTGRIATSGQPLPEQFEMIAEAGYVAVINLALPDHVDAYVEEGAIVTRLGMKYVHIPVPFDAPEPRHWRQFRDVMNALENEKVFVHCIMNYRVSVFLLHYLQRSQHLSEADARSPMFDRWQPDEVWQGVLNWTDADLDGCQK